ncbi:MAG: helix-turn-helix transcriptional regulator [Candidatus Pseudobacter hemicellulosilyticus]|uniref:Helix-turn-helix transcriptional regulator n=1 Tax=Candidatus Pseudobacter hemicellulosilyticus TaxID=3121375 RepID=A0AAJ5WZG4_9BACT|nr:MAG: helix-turn-helix transcriptional regulator [Pseudobacter sp.]
MCRQIIPVYDISKLSPSAGPQGEFLIERLAGYLERHYEHLHFPHRHTYYQLVLFTRGNGHHTIDFSNFDVSPFQLYCMIPGQVHSWHFSDDTDGFIINFSDTFFRSLLLNPHYLERFPFFSGVAEDGICQVPPALYEELVDLLGKMMQLACSKRDSDEDLLRLLLLQFFIRVKQSCTNVAVVGRSLPAQKTLLLRNFRRLIDAHFRTTRLPKEYADLLYVTPNHLNALCHDLLNKTAGELIRDRVLLEAKRLLTNAKMSVTEIAYELNFQDNSYFNRFFKKYTGSTPDDFRKQFPFKK